MDAPRVNNSQRDNHVTMHCIGGRRVLPTALPSKNHLEIVVDDFQLICVHIVADKVVNLKTVE